MNKVYRILWNASKGLWQVASECGPRRGRQQRARKALPALVAAGSLLLSATGAVADGLPSGGQVTFGQGSIEQTGPSMTVHQSSHKMAVDWQAFSIGAGQRVEFVQPSDAAVALNRVRGSDVSSIQGALSANGRIFLINPNGVLFGGSAMVDVGSLVASTLDIDDSDFAAGNYRFSGDSAAAVLNQGRITAAEGGHVALIAARIENTGRIEADGGAVLMGAGSRVTLDVGGPVKLEVEAAALEALIEQGGALRADGGTIFLTARAAEDLAATVINHTGISEARTLATGEGGSIRLIGDGGRVAVAGTLDASAPDGGHGGFIETSGPRVSLAPDVHVTTLAADGSAGTYLIDPTDLYVRADCSAISDSTCLNSDTINTALGFNNMVFETAAADTEGDAGDIFIQSDITYTGARNTSLHLRAHRDIRVSEDVSVTATHAKLNLALQANHNGSGGGAIDVGPGASIRTNGGDLIFTGGLIPLVSDDPLIGDFAALRSSGHAEGREGRTTGIRLAAGVTLDTRASGELATDGDIVLRGRAYWDGNTSEGHAVDLAGTAGSADDRVTINAGSGDIEFHNDGGNSSSSVRISHADLSAGNEDFALVARSRLGTGLQIHDSKLDLGHGSLTLEGHRVGSAGISGRGLDLQRNEIREGGDMTLTGGSVGNDAVWIQGTDLVTTGEGAINIRGTINSNSASGAGVVLVGAGRIETESGAVDLQGTSRGANGLFINGYQIIAGAGDISLRGDRVGSSTPSADGFRLVGSEVRTDSGNIDIDGRTNHSDMFGLHVADTDVLSASGRIRLAGHNSGSSLDGSRVAMNLNGRLGAAAGTAVTDSTASIEVLANRLEVSADTRLESAGTLQITRTTSGGMAIGNYLPNSRLNLSATFLGSQLHGFDLVTLGGGVEGGNTASTFRVDEAVTLAHNTDILTTGFLDLAANITTSHDLGLGHSVGSQAGNDYQLHAGHAVHLTAPETQSLRIGAWNDLDSNGYQLITNAAELQAIAGGLDGRYALTGNVAGIGAFAAVGDANAAFSGTFAGLGHTLSGFVVNAAGSNDQGLFGVVDGAVIRNLRLNDGAVSGADHVGLLVGRAVDSRILSSRITAGDDSTVTGMNDVGGLIGSASATDVVSQGSEWSVLADNVTVDASGSRVGGLIGSVSGGQISNASTSNTVNASGDGATAIGGLVGRLAAAEIWSTSSSATLNASAGQSRIGGLVGHQFGGTLSSSHAGGEIGTAADLTHVGGLVGHNEQGSIFSSHRSGALEVADHAIENVGGLVGWNEGGTVSNSYLGADLTARGLRVGGLVGFNDQGVVSGESHLRADVTTTDSDRVGGLVGENTGIVEDSYVQYAVWSSVLSNSNPERGVRNVTLTANGAGLQVGGVVGLNAGTVRRTYVDMTVSAPGSHEVGGLVGRNAAAGTIGTSYVLALDTGADLQIVGAGRSIEGADVVGGLVGHNAGTIEHTYAAAAVTASGEAVGGLVGSQHGEGTTAASFWDLGVAGAPQASAAGAGKTTAQMMDRATYLDAGWDLSNVGGDATAWRIFDDSGMYTDTYEASARPMLRTFMRGLTVGAGNVSHEYDGDARAWTSFGTGSSANLHQFRNPDTNNQIFGEGILGRLDGDVFSARDVGEYNLEFSGAYYSHQHGYDLAYSANSTLNITPRRIFVNVTGAENKVYDATNSATVTVNAGRSSFGGSAFISGDDIAFDFDGGGTFANANVGSDIGVSVSSNSFTLEGEDAANYQIVGVTNAGSLTANITQASVTGIDGLLVADRAYDGTQDVAAFDTSALNFTVSGNTVTSGSALHAELIGQLEFALGNHFGGANVGIYDLAIGTGAVSLINADSSNYTLDLNSVGSITGVAITPRSLTLAGGLFTASKVYDGTSDLDVEHITGPFGLHGHITGLLALHGLVGDEALQADFVTGSFNGINAGSYGNISVSLDISELAETLASNYQLGGIPLGGGTVEVTGLNGSITPKSITLGGQFTAQDRVYDGTRSAQIVDASDLTLEGLIGSESFALAEIVANFGQADAGTDLTVSLEGLALGAGSNGGVASNYSLDLDAAPTTTATIERRAVTVTADHLDRVYGDADPALTFDAEAQADDRGVVTGETLTGELSREAGEQVGGYAIGQGGLTDAANPNYAIDFTGAELAITARAISLAADAVTRVYGDKDPSLSIRITGGSLGSVSVGDTLADLIGTLTRVAGENVGQYDVLLGAGEHAGNYAITFDAHNGALSITPRPVQVVGQDHDRVYGESNPAFGFEAEAFGAGRGLLAGDELDGELSSAAANVGEYAIDQGTLGHGNYAIDYTAGMLTITPRPLEVSANDHQRIYGEANPALGFVAEAATAGRGLLEGDTLEGALAAPAASADVGEYTIGRGTIGNANYAIDYQSGTLTITPRALVVTADAQSRVYGDADPALTYQVESAGQGRGLVAGDSLTGDLNREAGEHVAGYAIGRGGLTDAANPNYVIAFTGDTFTITPRPLTVRAVDRNKIHGEADPQLAWSITEGDLVGDDQLQGDVARDAGERIGRYGIGQGSLGNGNYAIAFVDGTLVIRPEQAVVLQDFARGALVPVQGLADTQLGAAVPSMSSSGGLVLLDGSGAAGDPAAAAAVPRDRAGRTTGGFLPVFVVDGGIRMADGEAASLPQGAGE